MDEQPPQQEVAREAPPGSGAAGVGSPKKHQLHDLFPVLGQIKIEELIGNKEAVEMILQLLKEKLEEIDWLKNDNEKLQDNYRERSEALVSARTKLGERWKSQLILQVLTFIAGLCVSFAFKFDKGTLPFVLFLLVGIVCGLFAVVMPFVINRNGRNG